MAGRLSGSEALLTIDLGALAANWRLIRDRVGPAECAAVVKADAYGLGIGAAVPALWKAGCRTFFVAHLSEAERVRATLPEAVVYVLNGLLPGAAERFAGIGARPVLGFAQEITEWTAFCGQAGQRPAALHVDTGMNRLGLPPQDALALARHGLPDALELSLLMSHFVSAEEPANPLNGRQASTFAELAASFPGVPASLANSSGAFLAERPFHALVRPGYALYGGNPTPGRPNPMRPIVRLEAPIIQLREIEAGDTVGYNARWTAPGKRRVATIALGYADGFPRASGGTDRATAGGVEAGAALVGGWLCPFVGRVSMDLVVIDVTGAPSGAAARGAPVTLIGDELDIDEVGRRAGTIGYEVLTALGYRYERRYLGGP